VKTNDTLNTTLDLMRTTDNSHQENLGGNILFYPSFLTSGRYLKSAGRNLHMVDPTLPSQRGLGKCHLIKNIFCEIMFPNFSSASFPRPTFRSTIFRPLFGIFVLGHPCQQYHKRSNQLCGLVGTLHCC